MGISNHRIKSCNTVHHLVSRIAHRVYFLTDDACSDFMNYLRRVTEFSGLTLVGWCVMTNHFHLLVYVPSPPKLDEEEVLRRYAVLKGPSAAENLAQRFASVRQMSSAGEQIVEAELDRLRRRMYNVAEFMRTLKQWFSEEYNRRNGHKGTLWESVYHDKPVPNLPADLCRVLAYQHLNPIRAAITDRFDEYPWSSFTAFRKGDALAVAGMRFAYGEDLSDDEIAQAHADLMEDVLETVKFQRAVDIARRRAAGYESPRDPLTTEAQIVQAREHLALVRKELLAFHEAEDGCGKRDEIRERIIHQILDRIAAVPEIGVAELSNQLGVPPRTVYRHIRDLAKRGVIARDSRTSPWRLLAKRV